MMAHFSTKPQPPSMLSGKNKKKGMTCLYYDDDKIFGSPEF
jgi:hypothetical protein